MKNLYSTQTKPVQPVGQDAQTSILIGLQSKPLYYGTVAYSVKMARRVKNKAARAARKRTK